MHPDPTPTAPRSPTFEVFVAFLRLGLTSFGGPVAHLGYFRDAFVRRLGWLDERAYLDLVALCQFLPGPASSQVGIGIGLARAGLPGAGAAWLGFTLPSALALMLFGYAVTAFPGGIPGGLLHGLKVVAVAVVAQALWGMARVMTPDRGRLALAVVAAALLVAVPTALTQVLVIVLGGVIGRFAFEASAGAHAGHIHVPISRFLALGALLVLAVLLLVLPVTAAAWPVPTLVVIDAFFRTGALVFGGGHVVLPLLQAEVVAPGWVDGDAFLAGYGAAQAVPGPLFTFAAYLGTVMQAAPGGWQGALVCLVAVFAPSFLLVIGVLPYWTELRRLTGVRRALLGVNAAVVGLLLAAFYDPVWTSAMHTPADFLLALGAYVGLVRVRLSAWLVVVLGALCGWGLEHVSAA